jgi:uncharacterized membrane protein YdjX (TVP38/TMEM64 family)
MKKEKLKSILGIFFILVLFIFFSYLVQTNMDFFQEFVGEGFSGMFVYILTTIVAVVLVPISTLPLLPIVSSLWGWVVAALLSIVSWTIGALIAFWIAREYGSPLIKKFIPINKIQKLEKKIPRENFFWSVVFLRMVLPVDILSYALGLLSKMKTGSYMLATLIGVAPFAFVLSYLGTFPFQYQLISLPIAGIILLLSFLIRWRN